ncbi:response regulator [Fictibacillus iocasae]|uniref:Response regulator n=1 Tax=Fictibacillus iocasae TaxID=2715437 RepID=A0ABW2NRN9_9BACL
MKINVMLVDDHHMVRKGLRFFLSTQSEIQVVAEAGNGKEALDLLETVKPDIVLMDLTMPVMDGIEATRQVKARFPDIKIIILTSFSDQDHVLPALKAGAEGYQLKDIEPDELVKCIKAVHQGIKQLHPDATTQLLSELTNGGGKENPEQKRFQTLTARERDVLCEITRGKGNKEIAADLYITEKTVKTHVSSILAKLDLHDRTQAAILATKNKWFE